MLSPVSLDFKINTAVFIFEDDLTASEYGNTIEEIETSPNLEIIDNVENWDQTGLLTRILTWKIHKGVFDE